jgi:tRNA threonylcarbamoyladenosine biosynthesis protein TsaE
MQLICKNLDGLEEIAQKVLNWAGESTIFLLNGQMGAGKTTFSKALCKKLGVLDLVKSPTFSIVNEYQTEQGESLYHFDFYRLNDQEEALDIGVEEYFDSGNLCLIEWASQIPSLIPTKHLCIDFEIGENQERILTLSKHE